MSSLAVDGLGVTLGPREVLRNVTFNADSGAWLGVVGPNGVGKSTLLRAIAGVVRHTGTITVAGTRVADMSPRARARLVSWVPQEPLFPAGMTVAEYALLGRLSRLSYLGREGGSDRAVVSDTLDRLGIGLLSSRTVETLSGGERRRVAVARALAQEAPVLLLDEPTAALDIGRQQDVLELIDSLVRERDLTVVAAMHDLTLAGQYTDRLVFLDGGSVAHEGLPGEVLTEEIVGARYGASIRVLDSERRRSRTVAPVRREPLEDEGGSS
jgi:iron complex transport system ATP-binding protein